VSRLGRQAVLADPVAKIAEAQQAAARDSPSANVQLRPAIISLMGHANHGKTSLLDALRQSNLVATEAGGITQQLQVFSVDLGPHTRVTLIDSPGQEIFYRMRDSAGALADVVVLLIAIDDGCLAQTMEVLDAVLDARMPVVLVFNKIDTPHAADNITKVKQQLQARGLHFVKHKPDVDLVLFKAHRPGQSNRISTLPTYAVSVSAKTGQNMALFKHVLADVLTTAEFKAGMAAESSQ
jgi:translation initiation factor IF-2